MHHVEVFHPESGHSPFAAVEDDGHDNPWKCDTEDDAPISLVDREAILSAQGAFDEDNRHIECPVGCGKMIPSGDLTVHVDLHFAESDVLEGTDCKDLAMDHVNKDIDAYIAEVEEQVAKKVPHELSLEYEDDFSVAPKGPRKHRRRRRVSKESTSKTGKKLSVC